ncbi:MAG: SH3 domain-containing protein [Microcoleaceae cyanobacterium]
MTFDLRDMRQSLVLTLILIIAVGFPKRTYIAGAIKTVQVSQEAINLCRQVNHEQGLTVQKRPTPNSPVVGTVNVNQQVTLIEGYRDIRGPAGRTWVQISFPISGFVSRGFPGNESNLIDCSEVAEKTSGESSSQEETPAEISDREESYGQNSPVDNLPTEASLTSENTSETDASLCREIDSKKAPRGLAVRSDASKFSEYRGKVFVDGRLTLVENYRLIPDKNGEKRRWVEISSPLRGFVSAGNLVECE